MLIKTELANDPSVNRLIQAWNQLYTPNFDALALSQDPSLCIKLAEAVSPAGRAKTAAKLNKQIIELRCELATIQTNALYAYMQDVMDQQEVRKFAQASIKIYTLLVDLYEQNLLTTMSVFDAVRSPNERSSTTPSGSAESSSDIQRLAEALEPMLLEFQQKHTQSKDWRALGFMTTQLNFCNQWLLDKLTPLEQVLFDPYLKFIEEHVAHPWQRVCAAAATGTVVNSSIGQIVEQMIPLAEEIAEAAYQSLTQLLPNHRSRRGALRDLGVSHSCIRDLKMFQAYLWLCVLEGSMASVEQELLGLCVMVLPGVGVKWEMMELWTQVLATELLRHIKPSQQPYIRTYTTSMHQIFLKARTQLDTSLSRSVTELSMRGMALK
ncbi:MAG: hypothetical protein HC866_11605 [Leptolyngbyaceae cyanobacterium RU_5_1]|nr:hypothetical protein [Leptolyngbyaceae cyanobacterium RU_5_1]